MAGDPSPAPGVSVILDFGVWGKDERSALRRIGAAPESTFEMSHDNLHEYERLFQVPDRDELTSWEIDPPPVGHPTWTSWVSQR